MMKVKLRRYLLFITVLLSFFVIGMEVNAESFSWNTYKTEATGFPEQLTKPFIGGKVGLYNLGSGNVYYKYASKESAAAICTAFDRQNTDNVNDSGFYNTNCHKITNGIKSEYPNPYRSDGKDWSYDDEYASAVAAIILEASGGLGNKLSKEGYYKADFAVNYYLADTKYKVSANTKYSVGKKLAATGDKAQSEYKMFHDKKNTRAKKMSIKLSKLKCDTSNCQVNVSFENMNMNGTSNKYSSIAFSEPLVKVNGVSKSATYNKSEGKITINGVNATPGSELKVEVSVTATRTYYKAQNYVCGKNQTLTPNKLKKGTQKITIKKSIKTKLSEEVETTSQMYYDIYRAHCGVVLSKVDSNGNPLTGSKFNYTYNGVTGELALNNTNFDESIIQYDDESSSSVTVFNQACIPIVGSDILTATLQEIEAPIGYKLDSTPRTIQVDGNNPRNEDIVNVLDTNLIVKKIDGDSPSQAPLKGAKMQISLEGQVKTIADTGSKDGNGYRIFKITGDCTDENSPDCYWETDETGGVHFIELEYDSIYKIEELSAPGDYIINNPTRVATLTLPDTVDNNINDEEGNNQTITFANYKPYVKISKQDVTTGKEVPGARLKVTTANGDVKDEWVSTNTPHEITKLPDGIYYLHETVAPKGYELNTTTIEFTVKNGKTDTRKTIIMNNSPTKLSIANTLLGKNIVTYIIGGMLVTVGAGVLVYGLKKKKALSK